MVPESDKQPYTEKQVYHRLNVPHCCVVFVSDTNDVTGVSGALL